MKYRIPFFLFFCILVATVLRLSPGDTNIIFPYDQARDALYMHELVATRHIPLLGPTSDLQGVHHGALYYYLLALLYALGNWDVHVVVWFFALTSSLTIIPLYFLMKRLFSVRSAVTAVILFIFSYEATSYARWISNPVLAIPLFPLFLLVLEPFFHKKKGSALLVGLLLGVLIQFELVLGYLLLAVLFIFLRSAQKVRQYFLLAFGLVCGALPLVVSELKFHFQGLRGILSFGAKHTLVPAPTFSQAIGDVFNHASLLVRNNLLAMSAPLALFLFIFLVFFWSTKS